MAKTKDTSFFCKECGYESAKWAGQCPACHEWNTFVEAPSADRTPQKVSLKPSGLFMNELKALSMNEIEINEKNRLLTGMPEFDRVLGGGIVKGALMLVGGDPGIGKSTILTQMCRNISSTGKKVLYISGEESPGQIKMRAARLGEFSDSMKLIAENDLELICRAVLSEEPEVVVIDSIQTMFRKDISSTQGSPSQIRECTNMLMQLAKTSGISIFIVGHVTKEGVVAGPRMLEHMVDTVLYFEGDTNTGHRILRSVKNRFGATNEVGLFEMSSQGLREIKDPSAYMLMGRPENTSGSIVSCSLEGSRPILVEVQALVARSALANPRRSASGIDHNRMNLIIAVLERRLGFRFYECDAYLNVVGGMRINETALDLAVMIALASAYMDFVVDAKTIAIGEVGLSGEIRNVSRIEERVKEAQKLGFKKCIVPVSAKKALAGIEGISIEAVSGVKEAINKARE